MQQDTLESFFKLKGFGGNSVVKLLQCNYSIQSHQTNFPWTIQSSSRIWIFFALCNTKNKRSVLSGYKNPDKACTQVLYTSHQTATHVSCFRKKNPKIYGLFSEKIQVKVYANEQSSL